MGEVRLAMSQRERDRLKVLHEVEQAGGLRRRQAADQLKLSERQVRRLVKSLKERGDVAVVDGLRRTGLESQNGL